MASRANSKRARTTIAPAESGQRHQASLLWLGALVAAVFTVYQPVWHGGLLWDDEAHVISETLRSWGGLWRVWTEPALSQQYYPVSSTAFWTIGQLTGEMFWYHATSFVLHATSAFLLLLILRRLNVAGAVVAATVFALHPVYVESVAWISEIKNTLSTACYLAALLAYLRFDESRGRAAYASAIGFFLLALGSKTVTASLPAAILVVLWWKRGRIDLGSDVVPLLPLFAAGMLAGLGTAWIEYNWVGASGARFELGVAERLLLAGRAVWFYALTIVWPANLMFNYPRWSIDAGVWWQYVFPLALIAAIYWCFRFRNRNRGPLAAALLTVGTLFPVLGFFNVYPFRFAFVADHFQYLASIGLVTALSAMLVLVVRRWRAGIGEPVIAAVIAVPLGFLTWEYSGHFVDAPTLYRETIARNPDSVLARGNLASLLLDGPASGWPEAIEHARTVLRIDPNSAAGRNLLGTGLQRIGRYDESLPELQRAIELDPGLAEGHYNLAITLDALGRPDEAIASYRRSLDIFPQNVKALHNMANVLRARKRHADALVAVRQAIAIDPDNADVGLNLADTLQASGDLAGAITAYQQVLARRPDWGQAWNNLGLALRRSGRVGEARDAYERAAQLLPDAPLVFVNLGALHAENGDGDGAVRAYERAIALVPPGPAATELHQQIAAVLIKLGRTAEAQRHLAVK